MNTRVDDFIRGKSADELARLIVAIALEDDVAFAEALCLQLASSKEEMVRGNALLGFGHIARRANALKNESMVRELIEAGLRDDSHYVQGQAVAAKDDIEHFIGA